MPRLHCFPPLADSRAEVLILGSMPGAASLAAGEYYAHPRNAFWRIMAELLRFAATDSYTRKCRALRSAHIAVWDVLACCVRRGSLDRQITPQSVIANDFKTFYCRHPRLRHVFFNGTAAENYYRRFVLPEFAVTKLSYTRLPSTSPAHAAINFAQNLQAWRVILTR